MLPPRSSSLTEKAGGTATRFRQKRERKENGRGFHRRKFPSSNFNSVSGLSYDQEDRDPLSAGVFTYVTGLSAVGRVSQPAFEFSNKKSSLGLF